MTLATRIGKALVVQKDGDLLPPGAGPAKTWKMRDERRAGVVCRGDSLDLYLGMGRTIQNFTMTPEVAKQVGFFLVRWWCCTMWFGLKLRLWNWSLRAMMKQRERNRHAKVKDKGKTRKGC
jgi:hypothetical protein